MALVAVQQNNPLDFSGTILALFIVLRGEIRFSLGSKSLRFGNSGGWITP